MSVGKELGKKLRPLIKQVASDVFKGMSLTEVTYAELTSLSPLTFKVNSKLPLTERFLVIPKYKNFIEKDIGSKFVFIKNLGGQTYFYLYETNSTLNNGPYEYEAFINNEQVTIKDIRRKE